MHLFLCAHIFVGFYAFVFIIFFFFLWFQMDLTLMEELLKHIDFHDYSFCIAVIAIIFNPVFWNVVRTTVDVL